MKLLVVLMLCAIAASAPNVQNCKHEIFDLDIPSEVTPESRNILVNLLVRQLIEFLRRIINNGSGLFGIPPLDPLILEHFYIQVPQNRMINLNLELKDGKATGFGGFIVNRSHLDLRQMTFEIDFLFPIIDIRARSYDLIGDLFTAFPLFGKGEASFLAENFRLRATLHLKQSDDGESVLIDRVENASFELPSLKCGLTGVIGGGDIDAIVNAVVEDVIIDYVNRFQGAIAAGVGFVFPNLANPVLDQLNTWRFIAPLIPRN